MSAYLCDSYHIGRVAAYLAEKQGIRCRLHAKGLRILEGSELAAQIAGILAQANVESINARYPDTVDDFAGSPSRISDTESGKAIDYVMLCRQAARLVWCSDHSHADMYEAAKSLDYQSCEYGGWRESDAFSLCRLARDTAADCIMRDIESDGWSLDKSKSQRPQGIPLSQLFAN